MARFGKDLAFFNVTLERIGSVDKERSSGFYSVSQNEGTNAHWNVIKKYKKQCEYLHVNIVMRRQEQRNLIVEASRNIH